MEFLACVWTREGVIKSQSFGYFYVYVHNSALEARTLPPGMKLGHLRIRPYLNFTDHDVVD